MEALILIALIVGGGLAGGLMGSLLLIGVVWLWSAVGRLRLQRRTEARLREEHHRVFRHPESLRNCPYCQTEKAQANGATEPRPPSVDSSASDPSRGPAGGRSR